MTQYLLSIYQPDGVTPPPEALEPVMRNVEALLEEAKKAGRLGFQRRAAPRRARPRWSASRTARCCITDGPLRRGQGAHRRLHRSSKAADLDAALEWARKLARALTLPGSRTACRSKCGRSRSTDRAAWRRSRPPRSSVCSARSTAARSPCWSAVFGDIDVAEEAVQDAFTIALERWPSADCRRARPGWIITTARNRAIDRLRREASRDDRHAQAALLHAAARAGSRGGRRARRSPAPDLHVLPSGARAPARR